MNYRHGYHAGNFADVLKHTALCELLRLLSALPVQGFQEFVGLQGGASALLHYGPKRTPKLSLALTTLRRRFRGETPADQLQLRATAWEIAKGVDDRNTADRIRGIFTVERA